jgi:hypothetical protein
MNTTELLAVFREEVSDLAEPYLWSDTLVYRYIDDAQKQFCRDTYGIADARSFKINVLADGTEWYKLDPRILKVRTANDSLTGREIPMIPVEKMAAQGLVFDGRLGPLRALITGLEKNTVRVLPKPNLASTVELRTFRLSEEVEAGDDFEIDDQHVLPLLYWVKHKAYGKQDSEVFDKDASDRFLGDWKAYCAAAKNEQSRASHVAGAVIYGGL